METDFNSQREEVRSRKRKQKIGGDEEIGQRKHRSGTGEEEIGNRSPPIECLEMEKMTADEREVFTKLIYDLSQGNLYIAKGYYDRSFWVQLVNLYNERMQGLNREYTKRTWVNMISMGQDLQCRYNKLRAAGGRIDLQLEEIFGHCESCKRRIPIFPTSLQKGQASTYTSASQAKKSGLQHGNSGGGNVHGNSGNSGGGNVHCNSGNSGSLNLRSHHERGSVFYGGETSSSVLRPTLPDDILKIMLMLVEEQFLRFDQYMELFKASEKWAEEGNFLIFAILRDPDILPAKKRQHIDRQLEAIFGPCPCCKRRIPIFPTTLLDKHLGNSGGVMRNMRGNSGNSGGQKSRSFSSRGGHSSRTVPLEGPQIPSDIVKVMKMLLMEKFLTVEQYNKMFYPISEWIAERHIILGLIRNSEIPPSEKAQLLISAAGLGNSNN